jgi:hypothetical protein
MRVPSFLVAALSCVSVACGGVTNVDDLFAPTSAGTAGKGGTGGATGGTGGTGGIGATGGTGGSRTGGTGGTTGGSGGVGGSGGIGGSAATGGTAGSVGGTAGSAGSTVDSGADVRRDVAIDARDAGRSSVRCGTTTCDPAVSYCCLSSVNVRCLGLNATTCNSSTDRLHCDDTADCPLGQICCLTAGASGAGADAVCTLTTGCAAPKQMLCDPTAVAPCLGLVGIVCSEDSDSIIDGYSYCHAP